MKFLLITAIIYFLNNIFCLLVEIKRGTFKYKTLIFKICVPVIIVMAYPFILLIDILLTNENEYNRD